MAGGRNLIMNLLKNSIEKVENSQAEVVASGSGASHSNTKPSKEKTKVTKEKAKSKKNDKPKKVRVKAVKNVDGKKVKSQEQNGDEEIEVSTEPEPTWNLTKDRMVKIRKFKGQTYVDIREYFMDKLSWEIKPGKVAIVISLLITYILQVRKEFPLTWSNTKNSKVCCLSWI